MNRLPRQKKTRRTGREGLVAVSEILVMIAILAGLFWVGSLVLLPFTSDPDAARATSASSSDRCVYRISVDCDDNKIWVYRPSEGVMQLDLTTTVPEQALPLPGIEISAIGHSRDGISSIVGAMDGTIVVLDGRREATIFRLEQNGDMIIDAAMSDDGAVGFCITSAGKVLGRIGGNQGNREFSYQLPSRSPVTRAAINDRGTRMCVAQADGQITFHNPESGASDGTSLHVGSECNNFAWSADEKLIAAIGPSRILRVYDLASTRVAFQARFQLSSSAHPTSIVFSPDGQRLAVATNISNDVLLFDLGDSESTERIRGHDGIVRSMQFSSTSDRLYTASYDGTIREWSVASCTQIRRID